VTAALGEVTPYALAIALSPFGVIVAILLLFTPRPRAAGGAFLAGWAVGIAVAAGVFVALASVVELSDEPPSWASWARLGLGVVLLLVGARLWLRRAGKAEPAWLRSLAGITPARALRLGLLLSANPKTLLLAVAGGLAIGAAELTLAGTVVAVAVFTGLAVVTVALPFLLHMLLGVRVLATLGRAKDWLTAHNATVMAVALVVVGILLTVQGIARLGTPRTELPHDHRAPEHDAPTELFTVTGSSTAVHGVRQLRSGGHCPTGGGCGRSPCAAPGWCPRRSA
jgi:hypothetical protein